LSFHEQEITDESEIFHAGECCKIVLRTLAKLCFGCARSLKSLRKYSVHLAVVKLIANAPDTDTLGLVCITLGHLVSSDFRIAAEVLAHNCVERLSCHIEKFPEETLLRERILFFMQSCFRSANAK